MEVKAEKLLTLQLYNVHQSEQNARSFILFKEEAEKNGFLLSMSRMKKKKTNNSRRELRQKEER